LQHCLVQLLRSPLAQQIPFCQQFLALLLWAKLLLQDLEVGPLRLQVFLISGTVAQQRKLQVVFKSVVQIQVH
jgi:hypothetical protein